MSDKIENIRAFGYCAYAILQHTPSALDETTECVFAIAKSVSESSPAYSTTCGGKVTGFRVPYGSLENALLFAEEIKNKTENIIACGALASRDVEVYVDAMFQIASIMQTVREKEPETPENFDFLEPQKFLLKVTLR